MTEPDGDEVYGINRAVCPVCGEKPSEPVTLEDAYINSVGDDWEVFGQFGCPNCDADLAVGNGVPPTAVEDMHNPR